MALLLNVSVQSYQNIIKPFTYLSSNMSWNSWFNKLSYKRDQKPDVNEELLKDILDEDEYRDFLWAQESNDAWFSHNTINSVSDLRKYKLMTLLRSLNLRIADKIIRVMEWE